MTDSLFCWEFGKANRVITVDTSEEIYENPKGVWVIPSEESYIEVQNKKVVYHFLPMRRYTTDEVKSIRQACRMTQHQFSELFGISVKTLESWEQGINTSGSAAARLLDILNYDYGFASVFCD